MKKLINKITHYLSALKCYIRAIKSSLLRRLLDHHNINLILRDTLDIQLRKFFIHTNDPIRYSSIYLAIQDIYQHNIEGNFAELGVWYGYTSKILIKLAPDKSWYLFDTFEGFDKKDLKASIKDADKISNWFKDTSKKHLREHLDKTSNIYIRKGYFPETAIGLENEKFAFVMVDFDLYQPIKAALEFFYPRLTKGGYMFIHDYNLPVFDWGGKKAVDEFFTDKKEFFIQLPDAYGSVVFKKL